MTNENENEKMRSRKQIAWDNHRDSQSNKRKPQYTMAAMYEFQARLKTDPSFIVYSDDYKDDAELSLARLSELDYDSIEAQAKLLGGLAKSNKTSKELYIMLSLVSSTLLSLRNLEQVSAKEWRTTYLQLNAHLLPRGLKLSTFLFLGDLNYGKN